jgi:mRNA interferase RelE/StbE
LVLPDYLFCPFFAFSLSRTHVKIDALAIEPRSIGSVKLAEAEDLYRIRVGSYRIIYSIQDDLLIILVVKIGHRRDIYR